MDMKIAFSIGVIIGFLAAVAYGFHQLGQMLDGIQTIAV